MRVRVIAGRAKGRKLKMQDSLPVRPTSDKVKGAVFNMLTAAVPGCRFLDLFAGSGAIGIEAWSRGAAQVVFVEKDRRVFGLLQQNLQLVGYADAGCLQADFATACARLAGQAFDVIYVDPPYRAGLYQPALQLLDEHQLLAKRGVLCLEHPKSEQLAPGLPWQLLQQKVYGDTMITLLALASAEEE